MRFKLLAEPPLPSLKAWFTFGSSDAPTTIADLKNELCIRVPSLKNAKIHSDTISLFLDDFELLDESESNIVREGDLISIKSVSLLQQELSKKRKASYEDLPRKRRRSSSTKTPPANRELAAPPLRIFGSKSNVGNGSTSSSSSEDSSNSSSDGNTSSSQSSESSDSSGSESDGEPVSAPDTKTMALLGNKTSTMRTLIDEKLHSSSPLVPPGHGKAATKNRNRRRRLKRKHEAGQDLTSLPPAGTSEANTQPLGNWRSEARSYSATPVMMASLRNKNKKRGFKDAMSGPLPPKIVFASLPEETAANAVSIPGENSTEPNSYPPCPTTRLIPPSERQIRGELPANIFVTSVDVEEGLYDGRASLKMLSTQQDTLTDQHNKIGEWVKFDHRPSADEPVHDVENLTETQYLAIERGWESFPAVADSTQLHKNQLVAWKALHLNTFTLTPEIMLYVGRILDDVDEQGCVRMAKLQRLVLEEEECMVGGDEEEEDSKDGLYSPNHVQSEGWRLVKN